jgi:uncharacterized membrane protein YesL
MKAFLIMGRTLKAAYDELFMVVFLSVAWWIGTVLVLPAGPVTAGIHQVANRLANYKRVDNSFFWEGSRMYVGRSWLLYLVNLLLPVVIGFSIVFYLNTTGWLRVFGFICIWLLLFVLMVGQYTFPLFWQQDEPDIRLALRNAALLTLQRPLYTFLILLFQLLVIGISVAIALPLFLLTPGLIALSANFALAGILQDLGLAPQPPVIPPR